ncbi:MAG: hypothetical protein KDB22_18910 [Planctomycetales bacterium]|nr:hypothetical protein [Planctomycetales bacterium]
MTDYSMWILGRSAIASLLATQVAVASSLPNWANEELRRTHVIAPSSRAGTGITRFVYLYPSDRPLRQDYRLAIQWSAESLRSWYTAQLGGFGPTLSSPIVQSVALDHPASFYGTNNPGGSAYLYFWNNVLNEAIPKTGAAFLDPENAWIFFVDAPAGCGQLSGGGTSGIVVMSHNDLRGLVGNTFLDCDGTPNPSLTFPPQRWIGGQGHELGHAYGLPHPPGCDDGLPNCDYNALMWAGFYTGFPSSTYLRADDKLTLMAGPYVQASTLDAIFHSGFE